MTRIDTLRAIIETFADASDKRLIELIEIAESLYWQQVNASEVEA